MWHKFSHLQIATGEINAIRTVQITHEIAVNTKCK